MILGITGGTGEGMFSPDATCTRAQSVTFLYRASGSPAVSDKAEFSDVSTTAFYADAVAWAAKKGIPTGIGGGLFGSGNDCTRGQIVTILSSVSPIAVSKITGRELSRRSLLRNSNPVSFGIIMSTISKSNL